MAERSFFKDISGVFAGNSLALVSSFLIDIVLSRNLGPEGRGLYASILVTPLIVVSFALLGIRRSAVYHLGHKVFDENRTVSGIISLMLVSSSLALLVSAAALWWIHPKCLSTTMVILALLTIPAKLILVYTGGIYIGKEEFGRSNLQVWTPQALNLIGVMLFLAWFRWDVGGALLALLLSNLAVGLVSLQYVFKRYQVRLAFDKEVLLSLSKLGIFYALAVVVMQLNYRVDLVLLQKLSTIQQVGYYSLGVAISDKLWQLPTAIGLVVMSRSANTPDETVLNRDVSRLLRLALLVVLIAAVLLWAVIPVVLPWLFGNRFGPSVPIVRWMLPGILMFVIVRILSGRFTGKGQPLVLISIFVPALLVNIGLNYLWIPAYGGLGAAWASNVSYTAGALALLLVFSLKMKVPLREIVGFKKSDFVLPAKFKNRWKKS